MTDISAGGFYTIALGHPLGTCTAAASLARKSAQSFDEEKIQMCQNSPKVFSWGLNYNGQLGLGDWRGTQSTPTVLTAFLHRRIVMIKAGFSHVLASALCWGKGFALDRSGNYTCSCAFGYKGIDCSLQCNGGASSPCNRRGTFDWQTRSYDPDRDADYDCEIDGRTPSTAPRGRLHFATGRLRSRAGSCSCRQGYQGDDCGVECTGTGLGSDYRHFKVSAVCPVLG
jgi:hypothetical protein